MVIIQTKETFTSFTPILIEKRVPLLTFISITLVFQESVSLSQSFISSKRNCTHISRKFIPTAHNSFMFLMCKQPQPINHQNRHSNIIIYAIQIKHNNKKKRKRKKPQKNTILFIKKSRKEISSSSVDQ